MKTALKLVAEERARQIKREGYSFKHDDELMCGELSTAGACYAIVGAATSRGDKKGEWPIDEFRESRTVNWPWDDEAYKPSGDPVRNLVKAWRLDHCRH